MSQQIVYGLVSEPTKAEKLGSIFRYGQTDEGMDFLLVTSFSGPNTEGDVNSFKPYVHDFDRAFVSLLNHSYGELESTREKVEALVRSVQVEWPLTRERTASFLMGLPQNLHEWTLRNLMWQTLCGGFVYLVDEDSPGLLDLTVHLTVAKMLGQTTIGILPSSTRSMLESTQLTLTDVVVGEADTRTLSLILRSLKKEDLTGGNSSEPGPGTF